jgi:hypothetical protein
MMVREKGGDPKEGRAHAPRDVLQQRRYRVSMTRKKKEPQC